MVAAGVVAGALAARGLAFRSSRRARHSHFHESIAIPAVGTSTFSSWDDEISDLFERIGRLQEAALLPAVGADLDEINALVVRMPAELRQFRQRGFVHQSQLEAQVDGLLERWDELYDRIADMLYRQQGDLVEAANRLLNTVDRLYEPGADRGTVDSCWAGVRSLQSRIEAANASLTEMYDDLAEEFEQVEMQLERIEWMLTQIESAKFQLYEGEAPVRAARARWIRQGDEEGPVGILHLTDQRVLFEQKEEVTTEKILFIKLKTEMIHDLKLESPISSIEEVKVGEHRDGFLGLGRKDVLEFLFDHTAEYDGAVFHLLNDDAKTWLAHTGRVTSGVIDRERTAQAVAEADELDQARREIPSNCPSCAAPIDQAIVRGMTGITCGYCGTVIRI